MIKVSLENIQDFGLRVDNTSEIVKRGNSKGILKKLEKKYGLKSHFVCKKMFGTYEFYCNVANNYVPKETKEQWIQNYRIYVASSLKYKFWIVFYKLCKFMKYKI